MKQRSSTVLLIDDNPADQFLVREAMQSLSMEFNLRLVSDGDEALEYLYRRGRYTDPSRSPRPDLILLDLAMPRLSGRQVAQAVKGDPQLKNIPVIVLSNSSRDQDVGELYDLGVNSYMQKPANFDEFTAALRDLSNFWLKRAEFAAPERA